MISLSWLYIGYIEPILAFGYLWIMWRIKRSPIETLQSSFFNFFVLAGIASCLNIYLIVLKGLVESNIPHSSLKDFVFNLIIFGSHSFSLSHTIGKLLVIETRFTAICCPLYKNFWTPFRTKLAAMLMFVGPALLYSFMIPLNAVHRLDANGVLFYVGVEIWAQQLSKILSFVSYMIFIFLAVPMCATSMYYLRRAQRFNKVYGKHERSLLIYSIFITVAHLVKSFQQIFWFITIVIDNAPLFDLATKMYNVGNTLTTFIPPLLLLAMSRIVRNEVLFGWLVRDVRYSATIMPLGDRGRAQEETTIT